MGLKQRLAGLEGGLSRKTPEELQRDAWQRELDRHRQNLLTLFTAIPEEFHPRIENLLQSPRYRGHVLHLDHRGLEALVRDVGHGWRPGRIPGEIVRAFLDDERFEPWLKCSKCEMRLPYAGGFWTRDDQHGFWQGPYVPLQTCPACGGAAAWRSGELVKWWKYFVRSEIAPPWRFHKESPANS